MNFSMLTRAADGGNAAVQRLRAAFWPIAQTSVAAGIAWLLTHDVLRHPQPFFAPISAVVCMSATNVLRGLRAAQMIVGVALGIVLGAGVHAVLGAGPTAMAVTVFVALCIAVLSSFGFIAQGLMFVNQTAVSAVLVLVFASAGGVVSERLFDALIGGGLALVFSILLFPANPVAMVRTSRAAVLAAVHDTVCQVADVLNDPANVPSDWPRTAVDRMHQELDGLNQVRATAHTVTRIAPRRWPMRDTIGDVDQQAARLGLLVSSAMYLARTVTERYAKAERARPLLAVLADLAAATRLADGDPAAANEHVTAARRGTSELLSAARDRNAVVLADVVHVCVNDLQQVIELPISLPGGAR
ncbi:FUSC family protein [Mycobacterium gastri]|uniref:Integral membrane bound transporter domain-containing protein n=1 Tax=Mycobacterium gastri TaxID=1777 RepID=A0A1X1VXT8_MYCGS|nr:FUSC family protein [Mycobacterium gastri]ETW26088.1 membrane protein [Mycobacterium gastri 'Wayne']ORV74615.1 hypothetical protein AWC07_24895 [Mycobacterium gastri]